MTNGFMQAIVPAQKKAFAMATYRNESTTEEKTVASVPGLDGYPRRRRAPGIERRMVATRHGHFHVRIAGPEAGRPLVLLHWTPGSSRQYEPTLPLFAARGFRAYAFDLMGCGASDPIDGEWLVPDHAQALAEAFALLGIDRATLLGGHISSIIATQISQLAPERVARLVLDGNPVWDAATREAIINVAAPKNPPAAEDGSHMAYAFTRALWTKKMWKPDLVFDAAHAQETYLLFVENLISGLNWSPEILRIDYPALLAKVTVPTLFLSADGDPLRDQHEKAMAFVHGARGHVFSGNHPLHQPDKAAAYVATVDGFVRETA
jgi:pimeloyl-ACP methyl ester carboxylesterase